MLKIVLHYYFLDCLIWKNKAIDFGDKIRQERYYNKLY